MIKKMALWSGAKKYLLIIGVVLSFAILKSFNPMALYSVDSPFLSFGILLVNGVFYWLIFEILLSFFWSALKIRIEKNIDGLEFTNILRFMVILLNLASFVLILIFKAINFYPVILIILTNILLVFAWFIVLYVIFKKHYFNGFIEKEITDVFFGFAFAYLFLQTIMWGVL